jgi:hypothetical protein
MHMGSSVDLGAFSILELLEHSCRSAPGSNFWRTDTASRNHRSAVTNLPQFSAMSTIELKARTCSSYGFLAPHKTRWYVKNPCLVRILPDLIQLSTFPELILRF